MKKVKMKHALLAGICAIFIIMAAALPQSHAEEGHGHAHAHEEGEEKHDKKEKEQHGHGHEEKEDNHGDEHGHDDEHAEGQIILNEQQIKSAGIDIAAVGNGALSKEVSVPAKITAAADRLAQIVPKASGTVAEARKNLGDKVEKGEVMALIESREMAEAIADFLAAKRSEDLARTTFTREKNLWEKKITAEQDYLNAQNAQQEAKIRLDLARQKLQALGHDGTQVSNTNSRFHELRAPISGRVINRDLTLGEYVDTSRAAYTVADLGTVWAEIALSSADLPFVREGLDATVTGNGGKSTGKLIFLSPALSPDTRTAKAIIEIDNHDGTWRAGSFATARIATSAEDLPIVVPKSAVQTIDGKTSVFVRIAEGFEKRDIVTGREDSQRTEIITGLAAGEKIAVSNTFTLKAELGKSEAGHEH